MVFYKRKTVEPLQPRHVPSLNSDVWYIPETREFFETYEEYLKRFKSEAVQSQKVIDRFPAPLKEPILRKIQFSTTSRLDTLVDDIYNIFKHDFYPGEIAIANLNDQRVKVTIREKAKFSARRLSSGEFQPATCKCRVELLSSPDQEAIVDESELTRDRKYFTKVILKTFIKYSVHRESWAGAPWLVKDEYAKMHRIDQTIPVHLQRHKGQPSPEDLKQQRQEQREKARQEKKRIKQELAIEAKRLKQEAKQQKLEMMEVQKGKPKQKEIKQQKLSALGFESIQTPNTDLTLIDSSNESPPKGFQPILPNLDSKLEVDQISTPIKGDIQSTITSGSATPTVEGSPAPGLSTISSFSSKNERILTQEDLNIPFDSFRATLRPSLKQETRLEPPSLVNLALETWLFLNMYSDPLVLDTFTFDDYLDVLHYDDPATECPLLNEIFCSLLCTIVGTDSTELLIQFPDPPEEPTLDSEDDDLSSDEENESEDGYNGEDEDNSETTNLDNVNGLNDKSEAILLDNSSKNNKSNSSNEEFSNAEQKKISIETETNRAEFYSKFKSTKWEERLRRRMFKDGGWQVILIGLLHSVLYVPEWKESIQTILDNMAPLDKPVTLQSALNCFMELSVELRLKALQILCEVLHGSNLVRNFIDQCLEESTRIRRERLENLREYKALLETLKMLEEKKKPYFPNGFPKTSHTNGSNVIGGMGTPITENSDEESDDELKYQLFSVGGKRPASSVTRQRKKRKNDAEMALAKENHEFRKLFQQGEATLLKIEELLDANREVELELVKLDTQRAKMLGKDRYHNRYWWLEGNGIRRSSEDDFKKEAKKPEEKKPKPKKYGRSDPSEKTAAATPNVDKEKSEEEEESDSDLGYLMGRIWVQGPTDEELQGYLKIEPGSKIPRVSLDPTGQFITYENDLVISSRKIATESRILIDKNGTSDHDLFIAERKSIEERDLILENHMIWGYYDDPDDVQSLIKWLNPYGIRESKLAKEIVNLKPEITDSMRARKEDLTNDTIEQEAELKNVLEDDDDIKELDTKISMVRSLLEVIEQDNINEKQLDNIAESFLESKPSTTTTDSLTRSSRKSSRLGATATSSHASSSSPSPGKRRSTRGSSRRATILSDDDDSSTDNHDDFNSHAEDPVQSSPLKQKNLKDRIQDQKLRLIKKLDTLKKEKESTITSYKQDLAQGRVLGWENAKAKERFGHSLYESQKKRGPISRGGSRKKNS